MLDARCWMLDKKGTHFKRSFEHRASSIEYLCAEAWMTANYRPFD